MKFFGAVFYGIIGSILFLGLVVVEGYGQGPGGGNSGGGGGNNPGFVDCNTCVNQGNRQNFVVLSAFLGAADGTPIETNACLPGTEVFVYIRYTATNNLQHVRFVADLSVVNNLNSADRETIPINVALSPVNRTQGGPAGVIRLPITLDPNIFDCSKQRLELSRIKAFWIGNGNTPVNPDCSNGNTNGQCTNIDIPVIEVGLSSLVSDFSYVISCLNNTSPLIDSLSFFVTWLQGGGSNPLISWSVIPQDGGLGWDPAQGVNLFDFLIRNPAPDREFQVQLIVRNNNANPVLADTVVKLIDLGALFSVFQDGNIVELSPDDKNVSEDPNGS